MHQKRLTKTNEKFPLLLIVDNPRRSFNCDETTWKADAHVNPLTKLSDSKLDTAPNLNVNITSYNQIPNKK